MWTQAPLSERLTGFSDDQSKPAVLVLFLMVSDSGYRNRREIINTGDHLWHAKCALFGGEKTQPEAVLKLAMACARVVEIIRMASPLAHLSKWACLPWS